MSAELLNYLNHHDQEHNHSPKYSVMISIDTIHETLRVASSNHEAMDQIIGWYQQLTNEQAIKDEKAKYIHAFILDSALKETVFGVDWKGIIIDFMLSVGYELVGDGSFVFDSKNSKQFKTIMFLSSDNMQQHLHSNQLTKVDHDNNSTMIVKHDENAKEMEVEEIQNEREPEIEKEQIKNSKKSKYDKYEYDKSEKHIFDDIDDQKKDDENVQSNTERLVQSQSSPPPISEVSVIEEQIEKNKENKEYNVPSPTTPNIANKEKEMKGTVDILDIDGLFKKYEDLTKEEQPTKDEKYTTDETPKKIKPKINDHFRNRKKIKKTKSKKNNNPRRRTQSEAVFATKRSSPSKSKKKLLSKTTDNVSNGDNVEGKKGLSVETMCAVILYHVHKVGMETDVHLITNLVKKIKLNGELFDKMGPKEFDKKLRTIGIKPTQSNRIYNKIKQSSKQEINWILRQNNNDKKTERSPKKSKQRKIKRKKEIKKTELVIDDQDSNGSDSSGF